MAVLKTPLRYPGGKSRAMDFLLQAKHLPDMSKIKYYRDGFAGGGSPAFAFAQRFPNIPIWINDKYYNLFCFWTQLRDRPEEMHKVILGHKERIGDDVDAAREFFNEIKEKIQVVESPFEIAWRFYCLNRLSFSGLTESSTLSKLCVTGNFTVNLINKLPAFSRIMQGWKITNVDYSELIDENPHAFVFLDPPYDIKDVLYGKNGSMHKGFDHQRFARICDSSNNMVMVTYNSNPNLRELFKTWEQIEWDLTYSFSNESAKYREEQKSRKELLCLNYRGKMTHELPF